MDVIKEDAFFPPPIIIVNENVLSVGNTKKYFQTTDFNIMHQAGNPGVYCLLENIPCCVHEGSEMLKPMEPIQIQTNIF